MQNVLSRLIVAALLLCCVPASAQQNNAQDLLLLEQQNFEDESMKDYQPSYIFAQSGVIVKYNPVSLVFGGLMYSYQKFISVQISSDCMYERSCSKFGSDCLKEHGIANGISLAADRLMRCNRAASMDIRMENISTKSGKIIDQASKYSLKNGY